MPDAKPRDRQRARFRLGTRFCGLRPLPEYLSPGIFPPPARRGPERPKDGACLDIDTGTGALAPQLHRLLVPGGHFAVLHMNWLPFEDPVAAASEVLVLRWRPL